MNQKRKSAEDDEVETTKSSRQKKQFVNYNTSSYLHILWRGFKIQKRDKYGRALEMLRTAQG